MFKRFASRSITLEEVVNATYRNSRILVFRNRSAESLPFEVQVDLVRQTARFKSSEEALTHAQVLVDAMRSAHAAEQNVVPSDAMPLPA
jgi:hypothetical protein